MTTKLSSNTVLLPGKILWNMDERVLLDFLIKTRNRNVWIESSVYKREQVGLDVECSCSISTQ